MHRQLRNLLLSGLLGASFFGAGSAWAQLDPTVRHAAAKAAQAQDPVGLPHLARARSMLRNLDLDPTVYDLRLLNATTDAAGGTHARLQQLYQGLRVKGGTLLSHADASGAYQPFTDALVRNITVGTTPRLTAQDALNVAARQPSHLSAYAIAPTAELLVYAQRTHLDASGQSPQPTYSNHTDPDAIPDPMDATQSGYVISRVALAYEVRTFEGGEGSGQQGNAWVYLIDAASGEVLRARPLGSTSTGTGTGKFSGPVSFTSLPYNSGFRLEDSFRQFYTEDNDHSSGNPVNNDADDQWGDGLAFLGDSGASAPNRQTAMVDGYFGSTVYWDLMSNVFGRQGPDGHFYSVNVFAHYGTNWDDAEYWYPTGNIHLGDGASRQALDCLGHENGHGLNDFSVDFDSGGEPDGLNESNSDIWGAMTTYYLGGSGFASGASTIPNTGGSFVSVCSKRNMTKPSNNGGPDAWYPTLGDQPDPHYVAQPNNRAFYFLAQGASPRMNDTSYSPLLPWGMAGIGNQKAARIWFDALTGWMDDDEDYAAVRGACVSAAIADFGFFSPEVTAVMNAYAGINVGQVGAGYPGTPPSTSEHEPNDTWQQANVLTKPTSAVPAGAPKKLSVHGGGNTDDWFSVTIASSQSVTARVKPTGFADYDLEVYDGYNTLMGVSRKGMGAYDLVSVKAPYNFGLPSIYYIRVKPYSATSSTTYTLDLDYF